MNARDLVLLPDVQASDDPRNIAIDRVGIRGIRSPITIAGRDDLQQTVASVDMFVQLPAEKKGTHMSRFVALLQETVLPLSVMSMRTLLEMLLVRLEASGGSIEMRFPFFLTKTAPVSGTRSVMDYDVVLAARGSSQRISVSQSVVVPVTTACPCSKQVADRGAHTQRSHVTITAELAADLPIDELIELGETCGSCELWALLKRADEKYVTERAFDNPKFVEDVVRDVAAALERDPRVLSCSAECENFESIHNHSAYARVSRRPRHD